MNNRVDLPIISLIVAAARNGVIGRAGFMPWHLPGDLRYFKQKTMGKPVIMGQKTWESLQRKPLPGRANIVLTRQEGCRLEGAFVAHNLRQALELAKQQAALNNMRELFIIGGAEVFKQALPFAAKIYLTEILADIRGDVFFQPDLHSAEWREISRSAIMQTEKDEYSYHMLCFERVVEPPALSRCFYSP